MTPVIKRVKKAINRLQVAYKKGLISYPRVGNEYEQRSTPTFFPHPPIAEFDDFSKSLLLKDYPFIKETLPLELANNNLLTPSTIYSVLEVLNKHYTDDMRPHNKKDIEKRISLFEKHLMYLHHKYGESLVKKEGDEYLPNYDNIFPEKNVARMEMTLLPFQFSLPASRDRVQEVASYPKTRIRDDIQNYKRVNVKKEVAEDFHSAMELFKLKKIGLEFVKKHEVLLAKQNMIVRAGV